MNKKKNTYGNDDFYYFYKKCIKGKEDRKTYLKVVSRFFELMRDELYQGNIVSLPYGLGDYYIYKYKPSIKKNDKGEYYVSGFKTIDFNSTMKLWKENEDARKKKLKVYFINKHSDGYKVKFERTNFKSKFIQKIYNVVPLKTFSSGLSKVMFNDPYRDFITKKLSKVMFNK